MILRNHGLIAASNSIAEAIRDIMFLEKACQIQIGALTPAPGHPDPQGLNPQGEQGADRPEIEQLVHLGWQAALRPL